VLRRFTNKRITIINTSPAFANEVQISLKSVKEIRVAPRGFGMWGDMVVFMKDGKQLDFVGMENVQELKASLEACLPGARM
jgi:hypothetical protein